MEAPNRRRSEDEHSLLIFYDDFVEFEESCAFLCDAVASMVSYEERFDASTAMGIKQFCASVKDRAQELRLELKTLQQQSAWDGK